MVTSLFSSHYFIISIVPQAIRTRDSPDYVKKLVSFANLKSSLLYFVRPDHVGKLIPFQEGVQGVRAIKQNKNGLGISYMLQSGKT